MLLLGYVTGNSCIVMEKRIWYNYSRTKNIENTKLKRKLAKIMKVS